MHQQEFGYRTKTLSGYLIGLMGSLILSVLAFGAVYYKLIDDAHVFLFISVLALIQLIVQSIFFLRLNASPEGRWNLLPFLFVLMIIVFIVGGSYWVIYNLDSNMGLLQ